MKILQPAILDTPVPSSPYNDAGPGLDQKIISSNGTVSVITACQVKEEVTISQWSQTAFNLVQPWFYFIKSLKQNSYKF